MDKLEEIAKLQALLKTKRRRLKVLQQRQATYGINTPPEVIIEIEDIQNSIGQIKQTLRQLGVVVEDLPGEEIPLSLTPTNMYSLNNLPGPSYIRTAS